MSNVTCDDYFYNTLIGGNFYCFNENMPKIVICVELEYANDQQKPIIPLWLDVEYEPDGWLGPLCYNSPYYDFNREDTLLDKWNKLRAKLCALIPSGCEDCVPRHRYFS